MNPPTRAPSALRNSRTPASNTPTTEAPSPAEQHDALTTAQASQQEVQDVSAAATTGSQSVIAPPSTRMTVMSTARSTASRHRPTMSMTTVSTQATNQGAQPPPVINPQHALTLADLAHLTAFAGDSLQDTAIMLAHEWEDPDLDEGTVQATAGGGPAAVGNHHHQVPPLPPEERQETRDHGGSNAHGGDDELPDSQFEDMTLSKKSNTDPVEDTATKGSSSSGSTTRPAAD